jgi:hypothetical protein
MGEVHGILDSLVFSIWMADDEICMDMRRIGAAGFCSGSE